MSTKQKKMIGLRRLKKLAEFLKTIPAQKFNYNVYANFNSGKYKNQKCTAKNECCTQACALGWSTAIFRQLRLVGNDVVNVKTNSIDITAATEFFSITYSDASHLFLANMDEEEKFTAKQVGQKIMRYVKEESKLNGITL